MADSPPGATAGDPAGRVLILAAADAAGATTLVSALEAQGRTCIHSAQLGQALVLLGRKPADGPDITLAIISTPITGLGVPAIAQALRSLPGRGQLPILVSGTPPAGLARCAALPGDPAAVCRLAAQDPAAWPVAPPPPPAAATVPALPVLDSGPLRKLDAASPGALAEIAASMQQDLAEAATGIPRLLGGDDPGQPLQLAALARLAHKLKGSSGSIGGAELSRCSAELEHAARAGEIERSRSAATTVLAALPRLQAALRELVGSAS